MMIWALFNDIAQRIITLDKWEQRSNLSIRLKKIQLPPGSKALDFGCGTGLFARVFKKEGLRYWGYDVDNRLITFASRLYPDYSFTTSRDVLEDEGPFDLVLANCCFHHIDDTLLSIELRRIKSLLADQGTFFLIDLILVENDASFLHRTFMKLEQGEHVRTVGDYHKHVERHFSVIRTQVERSHIFSFNNRLNPLYNDLAVIECRKDGGRF